MSKNTLVQDLQAAIEQRDAFKIEAERQAAELAAAIEKAKELESRVAELAKTTEDALNISAQTAQKLAEAVASRDSISAELEKAKGIMALNPIPDIAGVEPVEHAPEAAEGSIHEKFAAIKDPAERTKFYRAHASELWRPSKK